MVDIVLVTMRTKNDCSNLSAKQSKEGFKEKHGGINILVN